MPLAPNALTDVATVQARMRLAGGTDDALIEQLIAEASDALETFTGRSFAYSPAVTEKLATKGGPKILVKATPLLSVASIALVEGDSSVTLDPSEYGVEDKDIGTIYRSAGWPSSAQLQDGLNFDRDLQPGTERKNCTVVYECGYVTPAQVAAASAGAWPGAAQGVTYGRLAKPAAHPTHVWEAVVAGNTGGVEPAWPADPVRGQTLVDSGVTWAFTGIFAAVGLGRTLPSDLERASVITAVAFYRGDNRNKNIKSETVGRASRTYVDGELPAEAQELALRYARWA